MQTAAFSSFEALLEELKKFSRLPADWKRKYLFRGQADAAWKLESTLHRTARAHDMSPQTLHDALLREFQDAAAGLVEPAHLPQGERDWEYLARHHGLPSPILDWSRSPFIALFFAFISADPSSGEVALWMLDQSRIPNPEDPTIQIFDEPEINRYAIRAAEQRGVPMRIDPASENASVEVLCGDAVIKLTVPGSERTQALRFLDDVLINDRTIFRDVDGAARTALFRATASEVRDA